MIAECLAVLRSASHSLWAALQLLLISAAAFGGLALLVKGREAVAGFRRAAREVRVNLALYFVDALLVAPGIALLVTLLRFVVAESLPMIDGDIWTHLPRGMTFFAVVFIGDFVSYWRHRLEHTRWLWPAHAIHHSDTEMTWLTLARFHPINRATTAAVDITALAVLGFPEWALIANQLVRHYYGEYIHANLPWTYGPLGAIVVSPVMHRWHHARDVVGSGSNFSTIFSVFDRLFGTYYVPGLCTVPLGVTDDIGHGLMAQLRFPLVAWFRASRTALIAERRSPSDIG